MVAPSAVIVAHALRNALIPVLTVIGLNAGTLLGGAVVAGPRGVMGTTNQVRPGTRVTGPRGNTATKAIAPGCAFVNGQRVCR